MNVMKKSEIKSICGKTFAENFRKLDITQKQLADELEVTPAFVNQFLKGKRLPSEEHLCFICIRLRNDGSSEGDEKTIRFYMDHCYDDADKTLMKCKAELKPKSIICEDSTHE